MKPFISVVVATHNRPEALVRLAGMLAAQNLDPDSFELLIVDDASDERIGPRLAAAAAPRHVQILEIPHSGQAVARHRGALLARGDVLVFLDDDMLVPPGFLAAHAARHRNLSRAVVLGHIQSDPQLAAMPLFERFNARHLERFREQVLAGKRQARGFNLCTGNVSMRQTDYFAIGGFDASLKRSEDRDLGIRLEESGCTIVYADDAASIHSSDHRDLNAWLRYAYLYGRYDLRIAKKNPATHDAHPWRYWAMVTPVSRPFLATAMAMPALGRVISRLAYAAGVTLDFFGARKRAMDLAALSYGTEYFRGLREECGSMASLRREIAASGYQEPPRSGGPLANFRQMILAIRADHDSLRRQARKYRAQGDDGGPLLVDLVRKIGFQIMTWYRVMRFFEQCRVPLVPQMLSRTIRHLFGADLHWKARLAPGVSVVHGVGLVISHAAEVGPGCILFHNVTLGEARDSSSGKLGAPRLGSDVHVGPGATLLGPIDVGPGTKIMAGSVLDRGVPAGSIVRPAHAVVSRRGVDPAKVGEASGLAR
jgi:serine acetyltransferase/GT2 family glycosyltransferase